MTYETALRIEALLTEVTPTATEHHKFVVLQKAVAEIKATLEHEAHSRDAYMQGVIEFVKKEHINKK